MSQIRKRLQDDEKKENRWTRIVRLTSLRLKRFLFDVVPVAWTDQVSRDRWIWALEYEHDILRTSPYSVSVKSDDVGKLPRKLFYVFSIMFSTT